MRRGIDATVAAIAGGVLATAIASVDPVPAIVSGLVAGLIVGVLVAIVTHRGESRLARRIRTGGQ